MFGLERVKEGDPGEVSRNACGGWQQGDRSQHRDYSWGETWSDVCSPDVGLWNQEGKGSAELWYKDKLGFGCKVGEETLGGSGNGNLRLEGGEESAPWAPGLGGAASLAGGWAGRVAGSSPASKGVLPPPWPQALGPVQPPYSAQAFSLLPALFSLVTRPGSPPQLLALCLAGRPRPQAHSPGHSSSAGSSLWFLHVQARAEEGLVSTLRCFPWWNGHPPGVEGTAVSILLKHSLVGSLLRLFHTPVCQELGRAPGTGQEAKQAWCLFCPGVLF